ncbi:MAG: hypothetical protein EAZ61_00390 [Oscillatoriales cyanobacterium]|nr:MAG: hypothetical protein EAZ61_00390 [Oscillatoriales cyanobacterium]
MGTWKFLVQREGKQSWTALEGDVMSLEPGRYRIAARAPVANTPIAIEISVMQPDGERRHYRRSTRTNDDGLLAVIPFTDLSDGNWMLNCQTMGNPGVVETASMAWQVIEPARIEVADPWAEPEDGDGVSAADRADDADEATGVAAVAIELDSDAVPNLGELDDTSESGLETIGEPDSMALDEPNPTPITPEPITINQDALNPLEDNTEALPIAAVEAVGDRQLQPDETQLEEPQTSGSTDTEDDQASETTDCLTEDAPIDEPHRTNVIAMPGITAHLPAAWIDPAESFEVEPIKVADTIAVSEILQGAKISEGLEVSEVSGISESSETVEVSGVAEISESPESSDGVKNSEVPEISESSEVSGISESSDGVETDRTPSTQDQDSGASEADTPIESATNNEVLQSVSLPIEGEPLPDATVPDIVADPTPPTLTTYTPGQLKLQLDRTSFTVAAGATLSLSGNIQADPSIDPRSQLAGLHLRLRLREPHSSRVLMVRQFLLTPATGPILHFDRSVPVPERTTSKLLLGELLLCDAVPTTLDQQSFTITAGLESLLNNLTDRNRASDSVVWQKDQWSDAKAQADLPPKTTPPLIPLPPKPTLDLPGFVTNPVSGIDKSQLLASLGLAPAASDRNAATESSDASDLDFDDIPATDFDPSLNGAIDADTASRDAEAAALEASRRAATQAHRFPLEPLTPPSHRNDRFVSRLNQIAHDNELTSWLNEGDLDLGAAGDAEDFASGDLAPLTGAREVLSPGAIERDRETSQEIVLDRPAEQPQRPSFSRSSPQTTATRPVLPADASIPSPELIVPPGHLTAGRSILVRARMPELSARIYIKLWIYDRQNQALLDGPRWLTDFLPLGDGTVEGMVNLTVPYGGLDVQFEAIAVEVETDRESYKTAIERRIVPSAPPTLPLENSSQRY